LLFRLGQLTLGALGSLDRVLDQVLDLAELPVQVVRPLADRGSDVCHWHLPGEANLHLSTVALRVTRAPEVAPLSLSTVLGRALSAAGTVPNARGSRARPCG